MRAQKRMESWSNGGDGLLTGFADLDKWIRMRPGELVVIAGQSSMGKTSLGMQIVESMADQTNGCIAIFSAEMSGDALYIRMASALCGVNAHRLQQGKGTPEEIRRMGEAMESIRSRPIWVDDNAGPTTAQMLEQLARLNETLPVRGMLFDFMELSGDESHSEEQRVGGIAHNLKGIAKTLEIPVLALSQVNENSESRANKVPSMNDLRYSRKVAHLADLVLLITRWDYYLDRALITEDQLRKMSIPEDEWRGVASIIIGKQRNGPTGTVKLQFNKELSKFGDLYRPLK